MLDVITGDTLPLLVNILYFLRWYTIPLEPLEKYFTTFLFGIWQKTTATQLYISAKHEVDRDRFAFTRHKTNRPRIKPWSNRTPRTLEVIWVKFVCGSINRTLNDLLRLLSHQPETTRIKITGHVHMYASQKMQKLHLPAYLKLKKCEIVFRCWSWCGADYVCKAPRHRDLILLWYAATFECVLRSRRRSLSCLLEKWQLFCLSQVSLWNTITNNLSII